MLEREIGAGGMARVYLATLRGAGGFEKRLVLKQIRPEFASDEAFVWRFVGRGQNGGRAQPLEHRARVRARGGTGRLLHRDGVLLRGDALRDADRDRQALEPVEGAYVGVEICRALDYAHRRAEASSTATSRRATS